MPSIVTSKLLVSPLALSLIGAAALPSLGTAEELPAPSPPPLAAPPIAPTPTLPAPVPVPDAVLRAVGSRTVVVQLADGAQVTGTILSFEPGQLVLSTSTEVMSVPRDRVASVRLQSTLPARPQSFDLEAPPLPPAPRYVSLDLSLSPGVNLDVDAGLFHGFVNANLILPLATASGSSGTIWAFAAGAGVGVPLSLRRQLKLDLFAYVAPTSGVSYTTVVAFGAGVGLHYTTARGLNIGFKLPVLGYAAQARSGSSCASTYPYQCSSGYGQNLNSSVDAVAAFYLSSLASLPDFYIGYRF